MSEWNGSYHQHHSHRRGRWLRRIGRRYGFVRIFFFGVLPVIAVSAYFIGLISTSVTSTRSYILSGQWYLQHGLSQLTNKPLQDLKIADFEQLHSDLANARLTFQQARESYQPLIPLAAWLGGDVLAVPAVLEIASQSTEAGLDLYDGLFPFFNQLLFEKTGTNSSIYKRLLPALLAGRPRFTEARQHLAAAIEASAQIQPETLSDEFAPLFYRIGPLLRQSLPLIDALIQSPDLFDELSGGQRRKVYLVLAQNNDELRPTGGFIGTFGVVAVENGEIAALEYHRTDTPDLQAPTEPCPGQLPEWWLQLEEPVWACWDAQWTADFPTLAGQAEWFYEHGHNRYPKVDGSVALDLLGMEEILAAIGPVNVPEYGEKIDAANLRARIYAYRGQGGEAPHKKFLEALFRATLNELPDLPTRQAPALLSAIWKAASEKHLLLHVAQPDLQALFTTLNLAGTLRQEPGDYFYVVDTSMTTKGYGAITEEIKYQVNLNPDGSASGHASIYWDFPASTLTQDPALAQAGHDVPDYWPVFVNSTRVYTLENSLWSGTNGNPAPTQIDKENHRQALINRVQIPPGESAQIQVHYLLPPVALAEGNRRIYRLVVQKQPGTRAHPLTVQVMLPTGAQFITSSPSPGAVHRLAQEVIEFKTSLATDQEFMIIYRQE